MSLDIQWDHQFCLACDKQTDGATYCSESCRLADYEKTSSPSGTGASSPALAGLSSYAWSFTETASNGNKFYLSPAFNISSASVQQQQQQPTTLQTTSQASTGLPNRLLSTSSSYSSLSSMRSTVSQQSTSTFHLSDKARRELQAYASSFEQVRLQRRRSY